MVDREKQFKRSMKNLRFVVQKETWVVYEIRWCDTCQSKDSRRNGHCGNEKEKLNRKEEDSSEWSHPEELTTYSVMDMWSIRCARKRIFNHKTGIGTNCSMDAVGKAFMPSGGFGKRNGWIRSLQAGMSYIGYRTEEPSCIGHIRRILSVQMRSCVIK